MAVLEGTVVAGKYEIVSSIGEGGMGEVFRAKQSALGRDVALKLLKEMGPMSGEPFKRFLREAKILGALKHRNLVTCYEFGEWRGTAYIAMECVDGHSLMSELVSNVGLEAGRLLAIARQIVAALECAHAHGVTHRDLKPHNIMLCKDEGGTGEMVKLIDFGLARLLPNDGKTMTKLTKTGVAVGSVAYMAPEQCIGRPADPRVDLYALGAVLHHALRGTPPFDADNPVAMMYMHMNDEVPALGREDLPDGLENVIQRCLAKDPEDRYQSAAELAEALRVVAAGDGANLPPFIARTIVRPATAPSQLHGAANSQKRIIGDFSKLPRIAIGLPAMPKLPPMPTLPPVPPWVIYTRQHPLPATVLAFLALALAGAIVAFFALYAHLNEGSGEKPFVSPRHRHQKETSDWL